MLPFFKRLLAQDKILIPFILVLALILRTIALDRYETWGDEKLSISEANGMLTLALKPKEIFTKENIDNNNTLYNAIKSTQDGDGGNGILYIISLHYWTMLVGNSDLAVRMLSVVFGVCTVYLIYLLSFEIFSNKWLAILAMFLATIHPQLITYSQEARTYSFALMITLTMSLILTKVIKYKKITPVYFLPYSVLAAAAILSHYSTGYIIAAHVIILLIALRPNFPNWLRLIGYSIIPLGIITIWLLSFGLKGLAIISERNAEYVLLSSSNPANSFYSKTTLYTICAGWAQNLLTFFGNSFSQLGIRIAYVLPILAVPIYLVLVGFKYNKLISNFKGICLIFLLFSSLIYATVLSLLSGHIISFQQLYSIFSVPYGLILLGACIHYIIDQSKLSFSHVVTGIQLLVMIASCVFIYYGLDSHTKEKNKYEPVAHKILKTYQANDKQFIIKHKSIETALEINKVLDKELNQTPQIIDDKLNDSFVVLYYPQKNVSVSLW